MFEWKKDGFMFEIPGEPNPELEPTFIRRGLRRVLDLARSVNAIDERPPYGDIINELDEIILLSVV